MADNRDQDRIRKLIVRGFAWWLCVGLWTVALLTTYPVRMGEAVAPEGFYFPVAKCLHVSMYAFLTAFLAWLPLRRGHWLWLAFLSLHAAGTEYFQQYVPDRHGQLTDVLIDHAGLLLGVALTWRCWLPRLSSSSTNPEPKGSAPALARSPSTRG
ncbi:MAG TPA: VanZ family protein [Gemmataceae bacterium]|nr:VanZ family protein [Gemmataceae bacterium]